MRIELSDPIPLSPDDAFHLLRDAMPTLVPYLDDAESITVSSREEGEGTVALVNRWVADLERVPSAVRRFATRELISWDDYAIWTTASRSCQWRLQPLRATDLFSCSGTTRIVQDGEGSRLNMSIDLEIRPEKVPGVPSFLAKRLRPQIETFISGQLTNNMRNLAVSVRKYHAAQG